MTKDLAALTVEDFAGCVGEEFVLEDGARYELVEATSLPAAAAAPRPPFSLTFSGPADPVRPQGIQVLTHGRLGTLELFLVPIGRDDGAVRYEAVFA